MDVGKQLGKIFKRGESNMRTRLRGKISLLFMTFALVLAIPAVALADNVVNEITNGVGTQRDVAAGATTTVNYWIDNTSAGGLQACDATVASPAEVTLTATPVLDSFAAGATPATVTISPNPETFTACGTTLETGAKAISFSTPADAPAGTYNITTAVQDSAGKYNATLADFKLNVTAGGGGGGVEEPANTPPEVTLKGVTDGDSYEIGSVPAAECYVVDAEDGNSTFAATLSAITGPLSSYDLGSQTASCEYTDEGGLSDSAEATYSIVDTTPPDLNISGAADGTVFNVCNGAPTSPTFDPSDNVAIDTDPSLTYDSFTSNLKASGVGTWTYYAQAYDVAGNDNSETRAYSVEYGAAFGGFLPPINASGTRSTFKLTSTVPVKFRLTCNGAPISNAAAYLTVQKVDPTVDGPINEAIATDAATTGNQFRYTDGTYHFNLSTKSGYTNPSGQNVAFSTGTWKLIVSLDDGTTRSVTIDLRK
jgi:hypothetical protein